MPMASVGYRADFNSLAPGRSECDSKNVIFNLVLLIGIFRSSHDNACWWVPQDLTDDKSTLVQVMAWWLQATSHYLSQSWLSSLSPNGVARPQWVNLLKTCHGWVTGRLLYLWDCVTKIIEYMFLIFCTENDSDTVVLSAKFSKWLGIINVWYGQIRYGL